MAARNEILNQKRPPRKSGWMRTTALAAGFAAVGGAGVYYVLSQPGTADETPLETSQSAAIQQNDRGGVMVPDLSEPDLDEPEIEATPLALDQGELDRLRTENERLAAQIAEEQEAAAERRRLFEERLDEIEQENADQLAAMQAQLESDYSRRQAEAAAEQAARLAAEQAEADRRRALEEERARREEELARRMQAPPVMGKTGSETFANGTVGAERQAMSGDREFLIASAAATETRRATVTANPSNTVGQGTIIEAALEVAINSDLQGQVAAIVSRDVWSMDMTRVLVPRGSKLFGTYNSEMGQTQKRVLVAWTRLTTTDGQTVSLKSYGSDRLGRSGMVSEVNNHFASRFGSAALVSVISALPLLLSDGGDDSSGSSNDAAANVSASLSGAVGDVMKGYLGQKPRILVHQGSNVSIRVDSDLEFY